MFWEIWWVLGLFCCGIFCHLPTLGEIQIQQQQSFCWNRFLSACPQAHLPSAHEQVASVFPASAPPGLCCCGYSQCSHFLQVLQWGRRDLLCSWLIKEAIDTYELQPRTRLDVSKDIQMAKRGGTGRDCLGLGEHPAPGIFRGNKADLCHRLCEYCWSCSGQENGVADLLSPSLPY